jgi:hypothetical protein
MPKLYTHSRFIDLEFQNAYKGLNKQKETLLRSGIAGPPGSQGPPGQPGLDGLDSNLNVFTKYLVTAGAFWRTPYNIAIGADWDGSNWVAVSDSEAADRYLNYDFFVVSSVQGFRPVWPIFEFTNTVLIQRVYFHLLDYFYAIGGYNGVYPAGSKEGFFLYLADPSMSVDHVNRFYGLPIAWSGPWSGHITHPTYNSSLGATYDIHDRISPRRIVNSTWKDNHLLATSGAGPRNASFGWTDPVLGEADNKALGRAWGAGSVLAEAGSKLVFDLGFNTFYFIPGYQGPNEGSNHPFDLLPDNKFPLGGGCLAITVIYAEV